MGKLFLTILKWILIAILGIVVLALFINPAVAVIALIVVAIGGIIKAIKK